MSLMNRNGQQQKITVIVPTLNEALNIKDVFLNIPEFVDEIVVIDGNSSDGTRDEILKFRKKTKIIMEEPRGKGAAIRTGFEKATGDLIVMMDADGSHDPRELHRLLEPVLDGYDASKGSRLLPGGGSDDLTPFRKFGNSVFVAMVNMMYGANYTDLCYGYRAFKRETIKKLMCTSDGFEIETEQSILMKKMGIKVKEVPSFEARRKNGRSNLNSIRDGWRILGIIFREYFNRTVKNNRIEKK